MKLIISLGLLLIVSYAQSASIVRDARNTEGIIPTIVEEILKVELQSDLKKNSDVEVPVVPNVIEEVQQIKKIPEEVVVVKEEKIEETVGGVKETLIEKVETIENVPVVVKKEEIIETIIPIVRNVVKEEIPQIEELRNVPVAPVEMPAAAVVVEQVVPEQVAIVDVIPEPVQSSVQVQPEVEVEQPQVKNVIPDVEKPKEEEMVIVKKVDVVIPVEVKRDETPDTNQIEKIEEKVVVVETVVPEIKKVVETVVVPEIKKVIEEVKPVEKVEEVPIVAVAPVVQVLPVDEMIPETKQDAAATPNRPQQILTSLTNAVTSLLTGNRSNATASDPVVEEASTDSTTRAPNPIIAAIQNAVPNAVQTFQSQLQNVQNAFRPQSNAENSEGTSTNPLGGIISSIQSAPSNVGNAIANFPQTVADRVGSIGSNLNNYLQSFNGNAANSAAAPAATTTSTTTTGQKDEPQKTEVDNKIDMPAAAAAKAVPVETPQDVVVVEEPKKETVVVPTAPEVPVVEVKKTEPEHPVV